MIALVTERGALEQWRFITEEGRPWRVEVRGRLKRQEWRCSQSRGIERVGFGHFADLHGRQRSKDRKGSFSFHRFVAPDATVNAVYPHSRHLSPKVRAFVDFGEPLWSAAVSGIWCQHYSAGLTRVLDLQRREPSAKRTHLGFELLPTNVPTSQMRILGDVGEQVKSPSQEMPNFIGLLGRPRTSANRSWRREWDSNPRYGFP